MKNKKFMENAVHGLFLVLGRITIACVAVISIYLIISGIPAIGEIGLMEFLFGRVWESTANPPQYGILPFILTSVYGTAGAILLGVPVGFLVAVYLSKAASPRIKSLVQGAVGVLAGIPSVVYGLVGMMVLVPGIRALFSIALVLFMVIMLINAVLNFFLKREKEGT